MKERLPNIASISYGKDSLAQLEVMWQHDIPIDAIVTADLWATKDLPAYLPELTEFRTRMDAEILQRYGVEVTHVRSPLTFEDYFYREHTPRAKYTGPWGWPPIKGHWCMKYLKLHPIQKYFKNRPHIAWIGIAVDEPLRHGQLNEYNRSALVEYGITEADAMEICKGLGWVSPTYLHAGRDGCWFCPCQGIDSLRRLYREFPEYWKIMMRWDADCEARFQPEHTLEDWDKRFAMEARGELREDIPFRWAMLDEPIQLSFTQLKEKENELSRI